MQDFAVFAKLFQEFLAQRMAASSEAKPPEHSVKTPRSQEPLATAPQRPQIPVIFVRGRVQFSCPSCHRGVELPRSFAGKKARCPKCFAAIKAPHPRKPYAAWNLERDVDSLVHPERYCAAKLTGWAAVRRHHFRQARIVALLGLLLLGVFYSGVRKLQAGRESPLSFFHIPAVATVPPHEAAEDVVHRFLNADGWLEKMPFVRHPDRVGHLMRDHYEEHPGGPAIKCRSVKAVGTGYYQGEQHGTMFTYVEAETIAGETLPFIVEHHDSGALVEWESSVGYSPAKWEHIVNGRIPTAPMRVCAALADYYNHDFSDPDKSLCVQLQDPQSHEVLGYGYVPSDSPEARQLATLLLDATYEEPRRVILQVSATPNSAKTKQVNIQKLMADGWRTDSVLARMD